MDFNIRCSCGSNNFYLQRHGMQVGAYCSTCNKWIKWVGKKDIDLLKRRGIKVYSENYTPPTQVPVATTDFVDDIPFDTLESVVPKSNNAVESVPIKNDTVLPEGTTCTLCSYGRLDPISDLGMIEMSLFDNILSIVDKNTNETLGRYKINVCPNCGKRL